MHHEPRVLEKYSRLEKTMMTTMLRILLILVSVATMGMMVRKIRQAKVQIEDSIFWILLSMLLVVFSIFPAVADGLAGLLGIYSTANFLFLFTIFLLLVKLFTMTLRMSQLETRLKELVQRMALDELQREEEKQYAGEKER